ncbi:MAG TPA: CPBP family glutamic-type intramembrane protease [Polyangiaceae bacterium]|nr:CPBP family glutamic-type intramembrane protease [Polyangiaceae bacterium]
MKRTALAVVVITAANALAFRPEAAASPSFWLALSVPYAALAALAVYALWDAGTLRDVLRPKWGDLSVGAFVAAILLIASWIGRSVFSPSGTDRGAWLYRVYLQVGSSEALQRSILLTSLLLCIPVLEELVWRSWVLDELLERFGKRLGWPLAALLYALSLAPTAYFLADERAGLNPLLVLAALGCGLVWSFMAMFQRRLPPVIIAHVAFTYFSAVQFRFPGA